MNWEQIQGQWKQLKGKLKMKWGKLTDDDLDFIAGQKDVLVGKIQERYGLQKEEALRQVEEWNSTLGKESVSETEAERDRKLEAARQARQAKRAALLAPVKTGDNASPEANKLDNGPGPSNLDLSSETEAGSAEEQPAKG